MNDVSEKFPILKSFNLRKPPVPLGIISLGCPHCGGTLVSEPDGTGEQELTCLNCARVYGPEKFTALL